MGEQEQSLSRCRADTWEGLGRTGRRSLGPQCSSETTWPGGSSAQSPRAQTARGGALGRAGAAPAPAGLAVLSLQVKRHWILTALELQAVGQTPPSQQALPWRAVPRSPRGLQEAPSFPVGADVRVFPSRQRSSIRSSPERAAPTSGAMARPSPVLRDAAPTPVAPRPWAVWGGGEALGDEAARLAGSVSAVGPQDPCSERAGRVPSGHSEGLSWQALGREASWGLGQARLWTRRGRGQSGDGALVARK